MKTKISLTINCMNRNARDNTFIIISEILEKNKVKDWVVDVKQIEDKTDGKT